MSFQLFRKRVAAFTAAGVVTCGLAVEMQAQTQSVKSDANAERSSQMSRMPARVYEDDEIKVVIPAGWTISSGDRSAAQSASIGGDHRLLLVNNRYTLELAYDTDHASGVNGGRFIEAFTIPWLDEDDAWDCSLHIRGKPQPVNRALMFMNLILDSGDASVREKCGIQKDLGYWTENGGTKIFVGERRWFGGYFTTAAQSWFFESRGDDCGEKAYTLTSKAKTPDELPDENDSGLKKIINEAITIVDSIHYKRCPPANAP